MRKRKLAAIFASLSVITFALSSCGKIEKDKEQNNTVETGGSQNEGGNQNNGGSQNEGGQKEIEQPIVLKPTVIDEGEIKLIDCSGAHESIYASWNKQSGIKDYNVYVKGSNDNTYTKLDKQLIREYSDYYRVDALGLKAGSYELKIVSVIDGEEKQTSTTIAKDITVIKHDRSGFGFVNGSSSGAYNDDGTLKNNARVIYVSNSNKNTVTTQAKSGNVVGIQNIVTAMKSQKGISDPVCIRFIGNITDPANLNKGDFYVDGVKNLTIEGVGFDATLNGFGIILKGSSNVEVRNLGFMNCDSNEGDDCGLQQANDHIWVHNCDFYYGDAGSDADQVKGDGALDTKKSTYVTHSYNHFFDNGKCNLQGMKDETSTNYITYHHNWYDHSDSRHPRVRTCTVHVYNNYFDGNAKYGIASALGASIFAENNYFRSTTNTIPFMTGLMGHDIKDDGTSTLSKEAGGVIKEFGNVFDGNNFRYTRYSENNNNFDAYNASSRDEVVSSSVSSKSGIAYNNFDTNPDIMYKYNVESAEQARQNVINYAGRLNGGDLKWNFTDADDKEYAVNKELKQAIVSYKDKIVSILGIENASSNEATDSPVEKEQPVITGSYVKTFEESIEDKFFEITASYDNKATEKTYAGVTYTKAIKFDSKANVKFTLTSNQTLVIITNGSEKNILIDGNKVKTNAEGIFEVTLGEGQHEIKKGDTLAIYALIIK